MSSVPADANRLLGGDKTDAPVNSGMQKYGCCISTKAEDIDSLLTFTEKEKVDLTVAGPEAPLIKGIVDETEL